MKILLLLVALVQDPAQDDVPRTEPERLTPPEKEVVVIGQRRAGNVLDVASGVTVITEKQIRESGQTTVVEVLNKQPGFFSSGFNRGSADQVLDLRGYNNGGGNGQRTLVLVDGRKTNSVVGSSTDWGSIPLHNVDRIEIVRGPAAALYGDTAVAGVINIITKKGGKGAVSSVQGATGTWSTWRAQANLSGSEEEFLYDLYIGAEGTEGFRDHSGFDARNFTGRMEHPLSETLQGFLKIGYHEDDRERPGSLSKADIAAFGRDASVPAGSPSENATQEYYVDGGLSQSLGNLGMLEMFVNHTEREGDTEFMGGFPFFIDDRSEYTIGQLKHILEPELFGRTAVFTTGLDLSYETADADSGPTPATLSTSEYRRRLIGAYSHMELRPAEFLILSGSVRFDRALLNLDNEPVGFGATFNEQRDFNQWSPHAGATFKVVEEVALYAAYGKTFRFPTRDELIGFTTGTPFLDPENAETYEVGTRLWTGTWGTGSVTVYHSEVEDEIFFDSTTFTSMNFKEVTHRGVESEIRLTPWEWVDVFGTHTYTSARITDSQNPALEDKRYPVTPRFQGTLGTTLRYLGVTFTAMARYVGERFLINDVTNAAEDLESYVTYDARIAYEWKSANLFVTGYNLSDRETFDNGGVTFAGNRFSPNAERSFLAGAELRF